MILIISDEIWHVISKPLTLLCFLEIVLSQFNNSPKLLNYYAYMCFLKRNILAFFKCDLEPIRKQKKGVLFLVYD